MTYTVNDPRTLTAAIVAQLASSTGKAIGQGIAPANPAKPYGVLHALPDEMSDGTLSDPDADVWWVFQVNGHGSTQEQAQWMQHKIRAALVGWVPTVTGLAPSRVELADGQGILRDDDVQPPDFYSTDRFRLFTSPT